jgi:hypothetical protein
MRHAEMCTFPLRTVHHYPKDPAVTKGDLHIKQAVPTSWRENTSDNLFCYIV